MYSICGQCGRRSGEMDVAEERHEPTVEELARDPGLAPIAHEVLVCPCGKVSTWFSLVLITVITPDCSPC